MSSAIQSVLRTSRLLFQRSMTQEAFLIKNPTNDRLSHTLLPICSFSPQLEPRVSQEFFPIPETLSISYTSGLAFKRHAFVPSLVLSRQYQQSLFLSRIHKRHYSLLPHQMSHFSRQRNQQREKWDTQYTKPFHTDHSTPTLEKAPSFSNSNQNWFWLAAVSALLAGFFLTNSQVNAEEQAKGFGPPISLSKQELEQLASNLGISPSEFKDEETLKQACFKKLADACRSEEWEAVRKNKHFAERITDITGKTLFLAMVEEGREAQIKQLIQLGFEYRFCDSQGNNGLHIASANGYTTLVPFLSDKFGVNGKNDQRKTPLHCAIENGHAQVVSTLYNHGASLDIPWLSPEGISYSPIALAVLSGNPLTVDTIAQKVPKQIQEPIAKLGNLLHLSILKRGDEECAMLQHLLTTYSEQTKPLLLQGDSENRTPLHVAAYEGVSSAIRFLVKNKQVDIHQVDINGDGKTAVHWAALGEQASAIRMLDWLGANLEQPDREGRTPLLYLQGKESKDADECRNLLAKLPTMSRREKEEPQDYTKRPPENLVFQGGGAKGLAYVGVIQGLEEIGCLSEVIRVAGTSAGSITAALIALGYRSKRLQEELSKDFNAFLDPVDAAAAIALQAKDTLPEKFENKDSSTWEKAKSLISTFTGVVKEYWQESDSINPIAKVKTLQNRLSEMTGLCKGDELLNWVEGLVREATRCPQHPNGIDHCTFKELHELVQKYPDKYKDLYVYTIRLRENAPPEVIRLSYEDNVWQNVVISDAIRASSSIPGIFRPHILHFKPKGDQRHPRPDLGQCIDGGLIKNLPIDAFDSNFYQVNRSERGSSTNRRTLGFKFDTSEEFSMDLTQGIDLGRAVAYTFYHSEDILLNEKASDKDRIVVIPVQIGTLEFGADAKKKAAAIKSGKTSLGFFLNPRQEN